MEAQIKETPTVSHLLDGPSAVFLQLEAYGGICREKLQLKNSLLYPSLLFYLIEHHSWYCTRTFKQQAVQRVPQCYWTMHGWCIPADCRCLKLRKPLPTLQSLQTPSTKHVPLSCSFCLFICARLSLRLSLSSNVVWLNKRGSPFHDPKGSTLNIKCHQTPNWLTQVQPKLVYPSAASKPNNMFELDFKKMLSRSFEEFWRFNRVRVEVCLHGFQFLQTALPLL